MEGRQSEVRRVKELNILIDNEEEYFDTMSDSEAGSENIYAYMNSDSSGSDEEEESESEGQQFCNRDRIQPCGRNGAENINNPLEAWSILLTDEILNIIVHYTNQEINRRRMGLNSAQEDNYLYADLSLVEFKALLGLLYFSGLHNVTYTKTIDLWSSFGLPIYRATMPRDRFVFLMTCITFDDKTTRDKRCTEDQFSPIREIFERFIHNCKKYYTPHDNCTVSNIIVPCAESCQRCKMKDVWHGIHGIKILTMNDVKTCYMINALFYTDRIETTFNETIHAYYLRTLTQPIHGSGRNVTCSLNCPLYTYVMEILKTYNLTLVSMVERDEAEIRDGFFSMQGVELKCSTNGILLPYFRKSEYVGILQSSLHEVPKICRNNELAEVCRKTRKFYASTRRAAIKFNDLCYEYSTKRGTHRWALRFFFIILDQCKFNSFILHQLNAKNKVLVQKSFLEDLIANLIKPFIIMRINDSCTPNHIKLLMSTTFDIDI